MEQGSIHIIRSLRRSIQAHRAVAGISKEAFYLWFNHRRVNEGLPTIESIRELGEEDLRWLVSVFGKPELVEEMRGFMQVIAMADMEVR